ncbi:MAG: DUF2299 family protein [Candidatus Helarchaeota archaeon]
MVIKIYNYKNIEQVIRNWCEDEGIFRIKHKETDMAKNNLFVFDIDYPYNHPHPVRLQVFVPKGKDFVVILCSTKISPVHLNVLKADQKIIRKFVEKFVDTMFLMQIDYNLRSAKGQLDAWILSDRIFFDGLTKNDFYKCIRKIFNAQLYANSLLNKICMTSKGADLKKIGGKSFDIPFYG